MPPSSYTKPGEENLRTDNKALTRSEDDKTLHWRDTGVLLAMLGKGIQIPYSERKKGFEEDIPYVLLRVTT